jgi:hypothetical protein
VTWHVIVWALLGLAINSMAQPAGKRCGISNRYRMYLSSSPILCIADAVSMVFRLVVMICSLSMGPRHASRLLLHLKSRPPLKDQSDIEDNPAAVLSTDAWPRTIFFVLGALPAVIKLASLSGVPWTKTWGMMFLASFLVTELIALLAGYGTQVQPIFHFSAAEWSDSQVQAAHRRIYNVIIRLEVFDSILSVTSILIHVALIIWAIDGIISVTLKSLATSDFSSRIQEWPDNKRDAMAVLLLILVIMTLAGMTYIFIKLPVWSPVQRVMFCTCFGSNLAIASSQFTLTASSYTDPFSCFMIRVIYYQALVWFCVSFDSSLNFLCKKSPILCQILSIGMESKREGPLAEDGAGPQPQAEDTLQDSQRKPAELRVVDGGAVASLGFFLANLAVALLWYAFVYDATETTNPPWTEVFGKL